MGSTSQDNEARVESALCDAEMALAKARAAGDCLMAMAKPRAAESVPVERITILVEMIQAQIATAEERINAALVTK